MKLLLDEMLSGAIAEQLRERGYEIAAASERPDLRGLADAELFERAQQEGRATVTYNVDDFLALDRDYRRREIEHQGIVLLHPRRFPQRAETIGPLVRALAAFNESRLL